MKTIFVLLTIIIVPIILIVEITKVSNDIDDEHIWMESKLNTKYVLNKDTLIIIDYSILNNTFILSNGVEINQKVLK